MAIESILTQSFTDFELLLIDDGSTDQTSRILHSYAEQDRRIKVLRNDHNQGIPSSRNRGIDAACGDYLAIMDSDDRAHPQRLDRQVAYLNRHADYAAVGSWACWMDAGGDLLWRIRRRPVFPEEIRALLLFRCSLQHSASMVRTDIARRYRYREEYALSEDFDFWVRISRDYSLANLPDPLVCYRIHDSLTSRTRAARMADCQRAVYREQLTALGISFSDEDLARHWALVRLGKQQTVIDADYMEWANAWLLGLQAANRRQRLYPEPAFSHVLGWVWGKASLQFVEPAGWQAWCVFCRSPLWRPALVYACRDLWQGRRLPLAWLSAQYVYRIG